jgi:putative transposase
MPRRKEPGIPDAVLDQLLAGADPKTAFDPNGLIDDLKKALAERVLDAEMDHHLAGEEAGNRRNGYGKKTVITDTGQIELAVPRDRQASFDPQLIAKYQRRFPGFDDKIISMYGRGMSTREIVGHLRELYGIEVSPDLISAVTDAVLEEVAAWQARPLEAIYPLVFFDALRVKIRDEGLVRNKAIHIALGVRADGTKEILGLWLEQNEGAKFWLRVMNELKNRGVEDLLVAVVDGLKGFPDAITAVFPQATVQTCIVHRLRHSLDFVSWKDRKPVAAALKDIYRAIDAAAGDAALSAFEEQLLGPEIPGNRPELAARLGRGCAVLCLPRRGPADFVYDECYRGAEFKAAPGRQGQRPFPERRGRHQTPLPGLEPVRKGVDHAAARVVHGQVAVRRSLWRALYTSHGLVS